MSKVKTKKHDTFIDMTAMSDVTVLLLTFFMLTATFLPKEPIRVITPASVVEIKIPEYNLLTILIKPNGSCYINLDNPKDRKNVLDLIAQDYSMNFTTKQINSFMSQPSIGVPINILPQFLDLRLEDQDAYLKDSGIPADSTNNQLKVWVQRACESNRDMKIAIKADQSTPYTKVKNVIETLQDIKQNRFNLITTLKGMPEGF